VEITKEIAIRVRDTVDAGLVRGKGEPIPGQMCVEAAVCFAMGLPHSDEPTCVSPAIRALKIRLNDSDWSSDSARAKGMRRLALVQLGSAGAVDDNDFARRIAEMTIRKIVPIALRAAAVLNHAAEHKTALEASAKLCETEGSQSAAESAESIDTVLSGFAESVVQVLIEMKAPGCQWLDLVPINH
jgi:hypothetical protein